MALVRGRSVFVTVCTSRPRHAPSVAQDDRTSLRQARQAPTGRRSADRLGWDDSHVRADEKQLIGRLNGDVDGWYPRLGGMTRGSGFASAPATARSLRQRVFLRHLRGHLDKGLYIARRPSRWLQAFDERVELWTEFRYEDFPQEDIFGRGCRPRRNANQLRLRQHRHAGARARQTVSWAACGTTVGYMRPDIGRHRQQLSVDRRAVFTTSRHPACRPTRTSCTRRSPRTSTIATRLATRRTAATIACRYGIWNDVTLNAYDFHRFDVQMQQFVPLVASNKHVLSGRIGASLREQRRREVVCRSTSCRMSAASTRSAASANSGSRTRTRSG